MRGYPFPVLVITLSVLLPGVGLGQSKLPVQQAIEAQFPLTKPTADRKDIVTAGAVMDLLKDNLEMNEVTAPNECQDTYKGGKFETSMMCRFAKKRVIFGQDLSGGKAGANRTFVAGEKFWLIRIDVQDKAAVLEFLSDPISDVRYHAQVTYPFPSGVFPTPEVVLAAIRETVKAEPVDGKEVAPEPAAKPVPVAPSPPPPAKMADIAPPPPPVDAAPVEPPTIKKGLTKDQVIAMFGQPKQVIPKANSEIDIYPDMKVVYVKGKVSEIQ